MTFFFVTVQTEQEGTLLLVVREHLQNTSYLKHQNSSRHRLIIIWDYPSDAILSIFRLDTTTINKDMRLFLQYVYCSPCSYYCKSVTLSYHGVMHKTTIHVHVFTYTVMTVYYVYAHCLNLADTGGKIIYVWFNEQIQP